jgi:CDP-diacylglycerol--serine O-phosphatidyltransferase
MSERFNAANAITSASLACGFGAVLLAAEGRLGWAGLAVAVAAVLDLIDGPTARRLGVCGRFGSELDSLADLVAFGVAPAFILYEGPLRDTPALGAPAGVAFVVAGAWRLARFSLVQRPEHFVGVPIPVAGVVLLVAAAVLPAALALVIAVVLSALMVSTLPVPTQLAILRLATRRRRSARAARSASAPAAGSRKRDRRRPTFRPRPRRRRRETVGAGRGGDRG